MAHDERKRTRPRYGWKPESRNMSRMSGEGVERGECDDCIVHEVVFAANAYSFKCRKWVCVYDSEGNDYEEVKFFSYSQARSLETEEAVNCFLCLAEP